MWRLAVFFLPVVLGELPSKNRDEILNWCLKAKHHKEKPGSEDVLFQQCSPWRDRSCCTEETTKNLHITKMYGMNYDHCANHPGGRKMSDNCRRHFFQDHCFYECEPNIGPWVKKTERKIAEERFMHVPLCKSDCQAWFNACQDDLTCADNWPLKLKFNPKVPPCPEGAECRTFKEVFATPENLCENVWNHSWSVVPDSEPCMRIWFAGENPNRKVAEIYVDRLLGGAPGVAVSSVFLSALAMLVLYLGS